MLLVGNKDRFFPTVGTLVREKMGELQKKLTEREREKRSLDQRGREKEVWIRERKREREARTQRRSP